MTQAFVAVSSPSSSQRQMESTPSVRSDITWRIASTLNLPDEVVAVHRIPDIGPETWSVTIAGAPTLIGMNVHGVWTGTTNIKVQGGRPGIGYMSLLHRAIHVAIERKQHR